MAKTNGFDFDPTVITKAAELKREIQRLVKTIIDDENYSSATVDQVKEALCCLSELRQKKRSSLSPKIHDVASCPCPEEFRCPLSKEMMSDPVIVSTGQTFDRPFIERWLKSGNRICPSTNQVLAHTILTPNHLIRQLISQWCKNQGIEIPDPAGADDNIAGADRTHFRSLLAKLSSTISDRQEAAKELRMLTKKIPSFRALFANSPDAVSDLIYPLSDRYTKNPNLDLQEDIITTVLNLSIHDGNKKLVVETPSALPILIDALREGTISTQSNAAAAIFTLSALDSNKIVIGESGAIRALIDLMEAGHPDTTKDVASALFSLCVVRENKGRAVKDGAVRVIVKKIEDRSELVDELVAILAMLASHPRAVQEMGDAGACACLLGVARESACARSKENCVAILYSICYSDRSQWRVLREEESRRGTISDLAKNGTSRARRKASGILERMNKLVNITHTA